MKIKKKTGFKCAIQDKHGRRCARECESCRTWRLQHAKKRLSGGGEKIDEL